MMKKRCLDLNFHVTNDLHKINLGSASQVYRIFEALQKILIKESVNSLKSESCDAKCEELKVTALFRYCKIADI